MMERMRKLYLLIAIALLFSMLLSPKISYTHCQIPCGIYDDFARVQSMLEDVATIEKSIKLIVELSGKSDAQSKNQLVRWVMNKEEHAQKIISAICDYFLTQRVKPNQKDYSERLIKHHAVILASMEAKQNTEIQYAKALRDCIEQLFPYYPGKKQ